MKIPVFEDCFGKATDEEIFKCESICLVTFPSEYKEILKICDGGYFDENNFLYFSISFNKKIIGCVGMFHVCSENYPCRSELMIENYKNSPEFFPEGLISFGEVGNGDLICFDYRADPKTDNPPIVIWEHEAAGSDEAVSFIAPDFESFMNMLMSDEEAEKEYARLTAGK